MQSIPCHPVCKEFVDYLQGLVQAMGSVRKVKNVVPHVFKGQIAAISAGNNLRYGVLEQNRIPYLLSDPKIDQKIFYFGNLELYVDKQGTGGTDVVSLSTVHVSDFDLGGGLAVFQSYPVLTLGAVLSAKGNTPQLTDEFFSHVQVQGDVLGTYNAYVFASFVGFKVTLN